MFKNYIITYWIRNVGDNYSPFYEAIKSNFPDYTHPQENLWIIRSDDTANRIMNKIKPFMNDNDSLFVVEMGNDNAGWMPKTMWEWLLDNTANEKKHS